tara:strand:- start:1056 stop:1862 length:807 start_codon:yes stop_codon:yes gene_type:complete
MRTKYETIDIYHDKPIPNGIDTLLVYAANEYGSATSIAAKGILGDRQPDARIVTHLITNTIFNQTVDFEDIGWELYFEDNAAILCITNWPATPIVPLEEAERTWIYAYPPTRDTLEWLINNVGVESVTYISSTTIHNVLDSDIFKTYEPNELIHYDFIEDNHRLRLAQKEDTLFLSPPTWLFGHLSKLMGLSKSQVLMSGHDSEKKIDRVAADTLSKWLESNMNLKYNQHYANEFIEVLEKRHSNNEIITKKISDMMAESEPNQMLWG